LPGVFSEFDKTDARNAVNGSLWSLPLEFVMYLAVLGLGVVKLLKNKRAVGAVVVVSFLAWMGVEQLLHQENVPNVVQKYQVWLEQSPRLAALFFAGTLILLLKDHVKIKATWFFVSLTILVLSWSRTHQLAGWIYGHPNWGVVDSDGNANNVVGYYAFAVALPYIVMYLAFVQIGFLKPILQSATKWGDFSYGVYLYGYPVEQMIYRTIGDRIPFWAFIGLSCLGTLMLSILSWHLVEKLFLRLKKHPTHIGPEKKVEPIEPKNDRPDDQVLKMEAVA
jgi:peptidoglycan/LPS O-acetylase OafA/YrhL